MNTFRWLKPYRTDALVTLLLVVCLLVIDWLWYSPERQASVGRNLPELTAWNETDTVTHPVAPMIASYQQKFFIPEEQGTQGEEAAVIAGLSFAEQQAQQGLVRHLYIEDKRYSLNAILSKQSAVAVFKEEQLSNGKIATISRTDSEALGPYLIKSIKDNRVTLTEKDRIVWLQLFQPTSKAKDTE